MSNHTIDQKYDVAVIGAGTTGLQAALTLGRMRRRVVVFGTDRYRNDPTGEMHNFIGHDGRPPAELREAARDDLLAYDTVELVERAVTAIAGEPDDFVVSTASGEVRARRILLATGVIDELPAVPGVADLFGDRIAHCPYCHGFEYADTPVGILGASPHVIRTAALIERIASSTTVLTDGAELDEETALTLKRMGVAVVTDPVRGVCRSSLGLTVELDGAPPVELGGMFVTTSWRQATPFAEQLGLDLSPMGAVLVDGFGRTSREGVSAAGDMAQPPGVPMPVAAVLAATAQGLVAATGIDMELMHHDHGLPLPV